MPKKDDENGFDETQEQDLLENPIFNERLPEFDEYGTALNDI